MQQNETTSMDPRQQRIDQLTAEVEENRRAAQRINHHKNYDAFIAYSLKLEGQLEGLRESMRLVPYPTQEAPTEDVHIEI